MPRTTPRFLIFAIYFLAVSGLKSPSPARADLPPSPSSQRFKLGLAATTGLGLSQPQFSTPYGTLIASPGLILGGGPAAEIGPLSAELLYLSRHSTSATTSGIQFGAGSTACIHIPVMGRIHLSPRWTWGVGAYYEMSMETAGDSSLGLVSGPRFSLSHDFFIDGRALLSLARREGADRNSIEAQLLFGVDFL